MRKSQYFPFDAECQTRELLVPFLLRLWYDAVLVRGLNPGPPALEASTLPLGYRGGGEFILSVNNVISFCMCFFLTFVNSAWSLDLFIPATTTNDLRFWRISVPDCIHYIFVLKFLRKSQYMYFSFSCWMLNKYWYNFYFTIICNDSYSHSQQMSSDSYVTIFEKK